MTPKKRRVTTTLFEHLMKNGLVMHGSFFILRFIKDPKIVDYKIAIVAPKAVAKTAVLRNSLRRKGYRALMSINVPNHMVGAIFYKKGTSETPYSQLVDDIKFIFSKIK